MAYYHPCNRSFPTYNGYNQHIQHSAAHQYADDDWECEICDRCFATEHARHQHYSNASDHPYCTSCKRVFVSDNNLLQHMRSRTHVGNQMQCPFCKKLFTTASGTTIHLESGNCPSGLDRHKINTMVQRMDRGNVITLPMITMPGYDNVQTIATERAWNGYGYECYLCNREFGSLQGLNNHLKSPVHESKFYHCPKKSCGRTYKLLSGLIQHVESESCGVMRFVQVQQQARSGIQNMVGRMIGQ